MFHCFSLYFLIIIRSYILCTYFLMNLFMVFLLSSSFLYTLPYGLLCLFYLFHSAVIFTLSQLLFDCHGLHGFWFFRPLLYFNLFIFWFVIFLFCSSFFSLMFLSFYAFWGLLVDVNSISKGTAHVTVGSMCTTDTVIVVTINIKCSIRHYSVGICIFFIPVIIHLKTPNVMYSQITAQNGE